MLTLPNFRTKNYSKLSKIKARAELERRRRERVHCGLAANPVDALPWREWLATVFATPGLTFADHHVEFWQWVDAIRPQIKPAAFLGIWSRGGGKTSNSEWAVARVAATGRRKFGLYVRATQEQADGNIANIEALFGRQPFASYYPGVASRKLSKYGTSMGWKRNVLRTASGFTIQSFGLDSAFRGVKIEDYRPDFIVFDDVDERDDSAATTEKKISKITESLLPAGSHDVAVLGIQNLIIPHGIFSRLAKGEADFLLNRIVSGPHPAVCDLVYEERDHKPYIVSGEATWAGQSLEVCQSQMWEWGLTAFLREAQHEVEEVRNGMFAHINYRTCAPDEVPDLLRKVVWVDPAVTSTDQSDCAGICAAALGIDKLIYILFSYEMRTGPEQVLRMAILKAIEVGAGSVGIETDQGGDTWQSVYMRVCQSIREEKLVPDDTPLPAFKSAKAGTTQMAKAARAALMLPDFEMGRIVLVEGTHRVAIKALDRFPVQKPFDFVDALYWAHDDLRNRSGWTR